jgi:hypothetical protein
MLLSNRFMGLPLLVCVVDRCSSFVTETWVVAQGQRELTPARMAINRSGPGEAAVGMGVEGMLEEVTRMVWQAV